MSNIKSVQITGKMPYDLGGVDELIKFLGNCNLPCSGLNFKFDNLSEEDVEISSGGLYGFFDFTITGEESISYEYIKDIFLALTKIRWVDLFKIIDLENNEKILDVKNSLNWKDYKLEYYYKYPKYPEKYHELGFFAIMNE